MMKSLIFVVLTFTLVSSARILDETNSSGTAVTGGSSGVFGSPGATGLGGATGGAGVGGVTGTGTNGVIGGAGTGSNGAGFTGGSGTGSVIGGAGGGGVGVTGGSGTGSVIGGAGGAGVGVTGGSGSGSVIGGAGGAGSGSFIGGAGGAGVTGVSGNGASGVTSGANGAIGGAGGANGAIGGAGVSGGAVLGTGNELSFFMHDILGGSNPTAKLITGVVNNPAINGQIPFAKPNGAVLSVNNGVPTDSSNNALINNNNLPFLTGLSGTTSNIIQNNNGNSFINGGGNNNVPVVNGDELAAGSTLQKLMFGTMTVIDDELTEGHELGSGLVGRAQGFYVASSVDGTSNTMAFTALFQGGGYVDSLSFFGIHRSAVAENQLAVMGGTGKFVNAQGFATVKTYPATASSQNTDGLETLLQFTVYLSY